MRSSIIQNEDHRLDLTTQSFGKDLLGDRGLEVGEAFADSAGSIDLAISNRKADKQIACATTMAVTYART